MGEKEGAMLIPLGDDGGRLDPLLVEEVEEIHCRRWQTSCHWSRRRQLIEEDVDLLRVSHELRF